MKDQGSVYQRMHCPRIYYLILFQCDIFQITYNSHIHNITVDFRCPYTLCPSNFWTVVIFAPLYNNKVALVWRAMWKDNLLSISASRQILFNCLFTFEFAETETPNNVLE